jgi:hypothetical protein
LSSRVHNPAISNLLRRNAVVVLPCAVALLLALPLVIHGLPDYESHQGEEYQPLKTLKFFRSRGHEFHKWGPADNFLYAPGYALSLLYWKHQGTFGPASHNFPYGFHQPLQQLTVLILQSRILLLVFVLSSLAALAMSLVHAGFSRPAAFFALLLCMATNPVLIWHAVLLKGDGPMLAFSSLALGAYITIVRQGLTLARAFWLATFVAWAVSAKESAIALFALPGAALVAVGVRRSQFPEAKKQAKKAVVLGLVTVAIWYALLNVSYAPDTWLRRVRYLFSDLDPEIWGAPDRSVFDYLSEVFDALTNNLGPGGMVAGVGSLVALIWLRPKCAWLLSLPLASFVLTGMLPTGYLPDRFALPAALSLVPVIAAAVDSLRERNRQRSWVLMLALLLLGFVNLVYANISWLQLRSAPEDLVEDYVRRHLAKDELFSIFSFWPRIAGKSRLEAMGYRLDSRPIHLALRSRTDLPKTIFITSEMQSWVEDFSRRPRRAAMVAGETGFDSKDWERSKALGYRLSGSLSAPLPGWYPFKLLPLPAASSSRAVLVYRLD